ncbi:MAG: hypothetical protein ACRDBQ_18630 [Shewanella sp.]
MSLDTVETSVVSFVSRFPDLFRQRADSLEEFNSILYNEYTTLIEQSLLGLDYLPGVLDKLQLLLAANQLTAISLLVGVPEVDIIGTLDKISTRRSALDSAARSGTALASMAARESRGRYGLPSYDNLPIAVGESRGRNRATGNYSARRDFNVNMNVDRSDNSTRNTTNNNNTLNDNTRNTTNHRTENLTSNVTNINNDSTRGKASFGLEKDWVKHLNDQEGLSSGRLFSATFERGGNRIDVPMRLRLDVKSVTTPVLETIIGFGEQNKDMWERYIKLQHKGDRSGRAIDRIAAIKDIAFCNDLIEEYRRNRYKDKSGYYAKMMEKRNSNWLSGILTLSPSINNASGVVVVSQDTIDAMAPIIGGDFDDFNVRQNVFKDTLTVYYVVVDTTWNTVTIYTRGLNGKQEMNKADFAKSKSGSGDVNKIIEAYRSGAQPIL